MYQYCLGTGYLNTGSGNVFHLVGAGPNSGVGSGFYPKAGFWPEPEIRNRPAPATLLASPCVLALVVSV